MCNLASFIVTRSKVLWSRNSDSHSEILRENGISDRREADFAKVEIVPLEADYSAPFEKWIFSFDGDVPEWCLREFAERECRAALPALMRTRVLMEEDGQHSVNAGQTRIVLTGKPVVKMSGGGLRSYDQSAPVVTKTNSAKK